MSFEILTSYEQVSPYLEQVKTAANKHRQALGFLPAIIYDESMSQGRLWVAASSVDGEYLGHLLFGGAYPHLRVIQLFVSQSQRRKGLASRLVQELVFFGQTNQYLAIIARVAADLPANDFWQGCGFAVTRIMPGGKSRNRMINVRVRQLDVPRLFDLPVKPISLPTTIAYETRPVLHTPQYALDINVILDLVRHRQDHTAASFLIRAALNHIVKIVVTDEARKELARSCPPNSTKDPLLEFICELPTLPSIDKAHIAERIQGLRSLVFPGRSPSRKNAAQDDSDLAHLASCIHHGVEGFITREAALLRSASRVKAEYGLDIVSPYNFGSAIDEPSGSLPDLVAQTKEAEIRFQPFEESLRSNAESFLHLVGVPREDARAALSPGASGNERRRVCALVDGELSGIASWRRPSKLKPEIILYLYVDETKRESQRVIEHFLELALREKSQATIFGMHLIHGLGQTFTRSIALKRGFRSRLSTTSDAQQPLYKISAGGVVTEESWSRFLKTIRKLSEVTLEPTMPSFEDVIREKLKLLQRRHKGETRIDLFDLETLMSPGLFLFPGRQGLIAPIREDYAEELMGEVSPQKSFLPAQEAILRVEKAYFRSPRRASIVTKGSPLVFYVSGPRGRAVGRARITSSAVLPVGDVVRQYERQGVLSSERLASLADAKGRVHVFTFDNFSQFPRPVTFKELQTLDCSPANLITIAPLGAEQLRSLMVAGYPGESTRNE